MKGLRFSAAVITVALLSAWSPFGEAKQLRHNDSNNTSNSRGLLAQRDAEERRKALHDYFHNRRENSVKAITVTDTGQVLDWIDPKDQAHVQTLLPNPPPFEEDPEPARSRGSKKKKKKKKSSEDYDEEEPFELENQPRALGPSGTVPCLRRDLVADHLSNGELPHCMDDFLCKYGDDTVHDNDGRKLYDGNQWHHKFAGTREVVENFGASGYISVWSPYVANNDHREYSLAQVAVHKGEGSSEERIEVGWQVSRSLYGDFFPHLFVYYTTNGDTSRGDNVGGYNLDVQGFVQTSRYIYPGDRLTEISTVGGTQYAMYVRVELFEGNWWIQVYDEWVGYFPGDLWSTASGLGDGASVIDWGGEVLVYDDGDGSMSETDMGSGELGKERYPDAAYIRNIKTLRKDCMCQAEPDLTEYTTEGNSNCYSVKERFNSGNVWGNYFYFGGPGYNSKCRHV